nr:MAG TPA: hypothetical protein [Caudoviricetes sp.]
MYHIDFHQCRIFDDYGLGYFINNACLTLVYSGPCTNIYNFEIPFLPPYHSYMHDRYVSILYYGELSEKNTRV